MRKILLGLIIGFVVAIPVGAFADYVYVSPPWAKHIYQAGDGSIQVDVFDDAGHKCYVVYRDRGSGYDNDEPGISCTLESR